MSWHETSLTYPDCMQSIQLEAEGVLSGVALALEDALSRLTARESEAGYSRSPLSLEAEKVLYLREELDTLRMKGAVLTVSPYTFKAGYKQEHAQYLSPQQAIETLCVKLRDPIDKNRLPGALYGVVILLSANTLSDFTNQLNQVTRVFPLPDWGQVARQATASISHDVDKLYQPTPLCMPRLKPVAHLNAEPFRELLMLHGEQIAMLEALAEDADNVIDKLQVLSAKKTDKLVEVSDAINTLKALQGRVWSMYLTGTAESIASQLKGVGVPNNYNHSVASVLLSAQPLTFFKELLCSV